MSPVKLDTWRSREPSRPVVADALPSPLPAHVGAWLDRYLVEDPSKDDKPGRAALLATAIESLRPAGDRPAVRNWHVGYERWRAWAVSPQSGIQRRAVKVEATSRILLHVGAASSVTDGAILLHHTWGVPYLPGSALKGLVRAALSPGLRKRWAWAPEVLAELLGQGPQGDLYERASLLDFLDAPWVPERPSGSAYDWSPLALDVVTPHHSAYYTESKDRPYPTDFDEPVPTHRLSIAPGTRFHVVVEAPAGLPKKWLDFVVDEVLVTALEEDGIGAWTSSGYGRLLCLK